MLNEIQHKNQNQGKHNTYSDYISLSNGVESNECIIKINAFHKSLAIGEDFSGVVIALH